MPSIISFSIIPDSLMNIHSHSIMKRKSSLKRIQIVVVCAYDGAALPFLGSFLSATIATFMHEAHHAPEQTGLVHNVLGSVYQIVRR